MKIAVIGGRDFDDYELMKKVLDEKLAEIEIIVSGGAKGADSLAERYALEKKIDIIVFEADWKKHGRAAGPIRNKKIITEADLVVAFWDGKSKGTKSSINLAKKAGVDVEVVLTCVKKLLQNSCPID